MSKPGKRYIRWAMLLCENEAKGIFFVLTLSSDSPVDSVIQSLERSQKFNPTFRMAQKMVL